MRRIVGLSIAFSLGTTSLARGDEPYTPQIVPQCTKYLVPGVGTVCGYTLIEDWKAVLRADAELAHRRAEAKNEAARAEALTLQVESLRGQVETYARSQATLVERTERLSRDLVALDKRYQEERVKPRFGSAVAWTISGVSASALLGVAIALALN